jgi:hypothetical protein
MFYRPTPFPSLGFWYDLTCSLPQLCICTRPAFKVGSMPRGLASAVWRVLCMALISTAQLSGQAECCGKSQLWWIVSWSDHLIQLSGQEDFVEIYHESYKTHVVPWLAWSLLSSDLNPQPAMFTVLFVLYNVYDSHIWLAMSCNKVLVRQWT